MISPRFGLDSQVAFEVRDIVFAYDRGPVSLNGVSLTIRPGERVAILGANGSGKSTLLKILDGLYFPAQGSITAFGLPLTERAVVRPAGHAVIRGIRWAISPPGANPRPAQASP